MSHVLSDVLRLAQGLQVVAVGWLQRRQPSMADTLGRVSVEAEPRMTPDRYVSSSSVVAPSDEDRPPLRLSAWIRQLWHDASEILRRGWNLLAGQVERRPI
ncbi:MAG: hypothetical protein VKO21_09980 [Candidatus Sericytochromatia bacterium]|nr:hypothetical protein [Candidatus Sericytochromatia bacterium]